MFGANIPCGKGMRGEDAGRRCGKRGRGKKMREEGAGEEDAGEDAGKMRGGGLFANNKFVLRKFNIFSLGFSGYKRLIKLLCAYALACVAFFLHE